MIKILLIVLAAAVLIFAPHVATSVAAAVGAVAVWALAKVAVLGAIVGFTARHHISRRLGRY